MLVLFLIPGEPDRVAIVGADTELWPVLPAQFGRWAVPVPVQHNFPRAEHRQGAWIDTTWAAIDGAGQDGRCGPREPPVSASAHEKLRRVARPAIVYDDHVPTRWRHTNRRVHVATQQTILHAHARLNQI